MFARRMAHWRRVAGVGPALILLWAVLKAQAGPPAPQSAVSAAVASQVTYQGRLLDGEAPANGVYDFRFTLWDDDDAGAQVGGAILKDDVSVSDGLLAVTLDVTHSDFDGQALWLKIEVKADAEVAYTALDPRQPLTPVPYALSLVPGARVRGDSNLPLLELNNQGEGYGLYATSLDGTGLVGQGGLGALFLPPGRHGVFGRGEDNGVMGVSDGGAGTYGGWFNGYGGVKGIGGGDAGVSGVSQFSHGVYGQTDSDQPTRAGVHGYSMAGAIGVQGIADGAAGIGVKGAGSVGVQGVGSTGVLGEGDVGVRGTSSIGPGVQGEHTGAVPGPGVKGTTTTVSGTGVEGRADFGTGVSGRGEIGVHGTSSVGTGVRGEGATGVHGSSSVGYGVRGESTAASGAGVYARGASDASPDLILAGNSASNNDGVLSSDSAFTGSDIVVKSNDRVNVYLDNNADNNAYFLVYANGNSDDAKAYIDETGNLFLDGDCAGCAMAFLARNVDTAPLRPGDLVAPAGVALDTGGGRPIILVRRAWPGQMPLGVVAAHVLTESNEGGTFAVNRTEPAPANDLLTVLVSGLAQVRVAASVAPGDRLTVSAQGLLGPAPLDLPTGAIFAQALEADEDGDGLVWAILK